MGQALVDYKESEVKYPAHQAYGGWVLKSAVMTTYGELLHRRMTELICASG